MPEQVESRDPRVDPRPGDVLRRDNRDRSVTEVRDWLTAGVYVRWRGTGTGSYARRRAGNVLGLASWRKWAATAEVIRTAEESAK